MHGKESHFTHRLETELTLNKVFRFLECAKGLPMAHVPLSRVCASQAPLSLSMATLLPPSLMTQHSAFRMSLSSLFSAPAVLLAIIVCYHGRSEQCCRGVQRKFADVLAHSCAS